MNGMAITEIISYISYREFLRNIFVTIQKVKNFYISLISFKQQYYKIYLKFLYFLNKKDLSQIIVVSYKMWVHWVL